MSEPRVEPTDFIDLFTRATGKTPFPYQIALATNPECPSVLSVPTGLGKTAAAVMAWLWRRRFAGAESSGCVPRRLVYCLPARSLVEQTRDEVVRWLDAVGLLAGRLADSPETGRPEYQAWVGPDDPTKIRVHTLMGGELDQDWDTWPERDAVLIGTQDMLLSRALNRGYAMSRYRWPMAFGLLQNDAWWVLDEIQLMGPGLATATQLQAFRRSIGTLLPTRTLWMSATLDPSWLQTVDFRPELDAPTRLGLSEADLDVPMVHARVQADKSLEIAPQLEPKHEAERILALHSASPAQSRTLVIVNTVRRAQQLFDELQKKKPTCKVVLVHSQFREPERVAHMTELLAQPQEAGTIAICTQVIEAGVNVSSFQLITDLAPWSSLVQRFGRCNRYGEYPEAKVLVLQPADLDKAAPYSGESLRTALDQLQGLSKAGPSALPQVLEERGFCHVIRQKDLHELFDTTPDLAGSDIDISRYVRDSDDYHGWVFWRPLKGSPPSQTEPSPRPEELCPAPLDAVKKAVKSGKWVAWHWDALDKRWTRTDERSVRVGCVLLIASESGGYSLSKGIDLPPKAQPVPLATAKAPLAVEGDDSDLNVASGQPRTLSYHTQRVVDALDGLMSAIPELPSHFKTDLRIAAIWHDAGKAHAVFQKAIRPQGLPEHSLSPEIWAKSAGSSPRYSRPGFRHELASALSLLQNGGSNLQAYLVAAHHGRVRVSIRSLPHEAPPEDPTVRFARGIYDGDTLPQITLSADHCMPQTSLDLSPMELGEGLSGPSWLARIHRLKAAHGPFRLAGLEALLRCADWRGSREEEDTHE